MASMIRKATPKPKVTPTAKAKATPKPTVKSNVKAAEDAFQKMINSGKVKNLEKARAEIYKKYGVRPNGMTN